MGSRGSTSTQLRRFSQVSPSVRISRASQLDAAQIDEANISMLKDQLKKVFSTMPHTFSKYEPELTACLQLFVWRFSIWLDKPTPGNAAKGLRYRNDGAFQSLINSGKGLEGPGLTTPQKMGFLLSMVCVPYGWARLQRIESIVGTEQDAWSRMMHIGEKVFKVANLANFLSFLHTGRYRTVVERVLNARLVYKKPNIVSVLTFELLNQKLLWAELSELLLVLLPFLKRLPIWLGLKHTSARFIDGGACVLCGANPITIPYTSEPCGHLYCYYCLSTRFSSNRVFQCASCNKEVTSIERFKGNEPELNDSTSHAPQG